MMRCCQPGERTMAVIGKAASRIFVPFLVLFMIFVIVWISSEPEEAKCFRHIFEREMGNEKVLSFECGHDLWAGSDFVHNIVFFCDSECFLKTAKYKEGHLKTEEIFALDMKLIQKANLLKKMDRQQGKEVIHAMNKLAAAASFRYSDWRRFKSILKKEHYQKHNESIKKAVLYQVEYHPGDDNEKLWYDFNSNICWYKAAGGHAWVSNILR